MKNIFQFNPYFVAKNKNRFSVRHPPPGEFENYYKYVKSSGISGDYPFGDNVMS